MFGAVVGQCKALYEHFSIKPQIFSLQDEFSGRDHAAWQPFSVSLFRSKGPRTFGYTPHLIPALRAADLDLLHVHGLWMYPAIASMTWARHKSKPYLTSVHGMLDLWAVKNSCWKKRIASVLYQNSHLRSAVAKSTSLEDHLVWQLSLSGLSDREKEVGRLIIGNLDDDGYLRITLEELVAGTPYTVDEAESVLKDVQGFDPNGVAARDLPECLLLQLKFLGRSQIGSLGSRPGTIKGSVLEAIVLHHLKDLEKKQYARIAKALNISVDDVFQATRIIEGLEPKPGRPFSNTQNYAIVPDVFVVKNEGEWEVLLNDDGLPRMRISPYYKQLMSSGQSGTAETKAYMDDKLRAAQWVIRSIEQRNKTIVKVVSSIVKFQEGFFERGIQHLKPLVLKQVAEDIGMHESTISRVTANKYMYCPQGMLELKFFFNAGLQRADQPTDMLSSVTVREMIRKMVAAEDASKPLKDEEIAAKLRTQQVLIARRTVAKYRAEDNIPSATQRKRFF